MEHPTFFGARRIAADVHEISSYLPVPGHGILPVNAFVIQGAEPMLIDTGLSLLGEAFLEALGRVVDFGDLRWIWASHMDPDHVGNLMAVLACSPAARIVTNFLGAGKMILMGLPVERVHQVEPGGRLDLADRALVALRPPYYDAPETMGWFDTRSRALFVADAFGALMRTPAEEASAIPREALREGLAAWSAIDAPWLARLGPAAVARSLDVLERLDARVVLSAHLPPARGLTGDLIGHLAHAAAGAGPAAAAGGGMEQLLAELERAA